MGCLADWIRTDIPRSSVGARAESVIRFPTRSACRLPWSPEGRFRVPAGWAFGPPFPRLDGSRHQLVMGNGPEGRPRTRPECHEDGGLPPDHAFGESRNAWRKE